ncbi:MAG: SCO family protein [Fimbriimonadaceae bacterium]
MRLKPLFLGFGLAIVAFSSAQFYSPPSRDLQPGSDRIPSAAPTSIRIDQKLNAVVSPDWKFKDQDGKDVTTGELMSKRPTLLLMIFYKCTGVCATELSNVKKLLRGMKKDDAGELYDLVVVSIDPTETPMLAKEKRQELLDDYKRPGTEAGIHFLVGDEKNIEGLADNVGFRYYRDPANNRITHPAGLTVISPKRRITRYFISDEFEAEPSLLAIKDARDERVGQKDDRPFFLACVNVDPLTGQRSLNIMNVVRTAGVATVLVLAFWIFSMNRSTKKQMETAFKEGQE